MDKNSTLTPVVVDLKKEDYRANINPKKSTINFLKQFARTHSYEPKLDGVLGNFIAN